MTEQQHSFAPRSVLLPAVLQVDGEAPCFRAIASLSGQGLAFDFQSTPLTPQFVGQTAQLDFDVQGQHHSCKSLIINIQGQRALLSMRNASASILAALQSVNRGYAPSLAARLSTLQAQQSCHVQFMDSMKAVVNTFYQLRLRRLGADYLAYSLVDLIVDHYFLILERLGETIEDLEEELVSKPTQGTLRRIHQLKREMIILRRSVWPLREVLSQLQRRESPLIEEATAIYFKDVYDHVIQVIDTVETFRDMLSGMLDVYLSSVSTPLTEVMKVLTIIATIFIPLTSWPGSTA